MLHHLVRQRGSVVFNETDGLNIAFALVYPGLCMDGVRRSACPRLDRGLAGVDNVPTRPDASGCTTLPATMHKMG